MAKKKKITRKELLGKPDEFITLSSKMLTFISENQTQIFLGLIVFLVVVISAVGLKYYSTKTERQASDRLGIMMARYETVKKTSGPGVAYQAVEKEAQFLVDEYSNRSAGKLAMVLFADISFSAGEIETAIQYYTKALNVFDADSTVHYSIMNGLGYCYEEKGDYKEAVKYFQRIASGNNPAAKGEAFYNLGRLYAEMGDHEKSIAAFNKILSDYSDSIYIDLVKEKLGG